MALMKEIGVDWRLYETHFTEYTIESFEEESALVGLYVKHVEFRSVDIWCELRDATVPK